MQIAHLTTLVNLYKADAFADGVITAEGTVGDTLNMLESLGAKIDHDPVNPCGVFTDNHGLPFEVRVYESEDYNGQVDLCFADLG
jgi:hypothetical protein